jgi:hypothetical protein
MSFCNEISFCFEQSLRFSSSLPDFPFPPVGNDPEMIMKSFVSWKYLYSSIFTNRGFVFSLFTLLGTGREVF